MKNESNGLATRPRVQASKRKNAVTMWDQTAPETKHIGLRYGAYLVGILAVLTGLHLWLSPSKFYAHWLLILAVDALGIAGTLFAWLGAWRAASADSRTKELLDRLEETNTIVRKSPRAYQEVFDQHILSLLNRAGALESKARSSSHISLMLSTPAYGYHVLGLKAHQDFQNALRDVKCNLNVFLFTPDAHFSHVANTLLWNPLTKPHSPAPIEITPNELLGCMRDTLDWLYLQVDWCEKNTESPRVSVWIRDDAAFRLTSLEASESATGPEAYIVLTDPVTLSTDLRRFTGRLLAVPNSLFRTLVGSHNDPESFIETAKHCPYSSLTGKEARLITSELEALKYDYIFLRTEHILFDVSSFETQCRRAIYAASGDPNADVGRGLDSILRGVVDYFSTLNRDHRIPECFASKQSLQQSKLAILPDLVAILGATKSDVTAISAKLRSALLTHIPAHPGDRFIDLRLPEYLKSPDELSPWFAIIYYLITSGFGECLLAPARSNRAKNPHANPASCTLVQDRTGTNGDEQVRGHRTETRVGNDGVSVPQDIALEQPPIIQPVGPSLQSQPRSASDHAFQSDSTSPQVVSGGGKE